MAYSTYGWDPNNANGNPYAGLLKLQNQNLASIGNRPNIDYNQYLTGNLGSSDFEKSYFNTMSGQARQAATEQARNIAAISGARGGFGVAGNPLTGGSLQQWAVQSAASMTPNIMQQGYQAGVQRNATNLGIQRQGQQDWQNWYNTLFGQSKDVLGLADTWAKQQQRWEQEQEDYVKERQYKDWQQAMAKHQQYSSLAATAEQKQNMADILNQIQAIYTHQGTGTQTISNLNQLSQLMNQLYAAYGWKPGQSGGGRGGGGGMSVYDPTTWSAQAEAARSEAYKSETLNDLIRQKIQAGSTFYGG